MSVDAPNTAALLPIEIRPIGVARNGRTDAGDFNWGDVVSSIELDAQRFDARALTGLDGFSHVEIVFFLHRISAATVVCGSRHPRDNPDWPEVGIFAQRAAVRPNCIGVSRARIRSVHDLVVEVEGLDALVGTPILDIKPYMREFVPREAVRQPAWCAEVMKGYF
jgi:tRNA-Thr(GGU) m(6)t(6)A37 methyltransferase TsaA